MRIESQIFSSLTIGSSSVYRYRQELHPRLVLCQTTEVESLSLFPYRLEIHHAEHCTISVADC